MLGVSFIVDQLQAAIQKREMRDALFKTCPEEHRSALLAQFQREDEEADRERRHQELCQAIRDSRPRGFGVFW